MAKQKNPNEKISTARINPPWDRRFGPDDSENAILLNTIIACSIDWVNSSGVETCVFPSDEAVYPYLEESPKTSLVVEIVDKLHELGFEIKKKESC